MDETFYVVALHVLMSCFGFLLMGFDKYKAIKGARRVPERVLIGLAALTGAMGVALGMLVFKHKSSKAKFRVLVPLFLTVQWAILLLSLIGWLSF